MIEELEPLGPYPCECGAESTMALCAVVESRRQFVLMSQWFCVEHASDAVALCMALASDGHVVALFDRSEAVEQLESMHRVLLEHAEVYGELVHDGSIRQAAAAAGNRAARRARATGRHRQRRRGQVAPHQRPKHQGPPAA